MNLWTEYEGKTVAGNYQLTSLLRSEGRSAFFSIGSGAHKNDVIRLTEAHFDAEEMLMRWQHVAAVQQDNLIEIRSTGQTTLDGVAVTYAVLEPGDATLSDVLAERPLTTAETMDVARAVASALSALHGSGLVHEHIEAANVLAVGETVKLRSDCVRECVIDQEFSTAEDCQQLRRRDVHDLGVLLLQCLTLSRELQPGVALPQPFAQMVPGAIDGSWNLARISSTLQPPAAAQPAVAQPAAEQEQPMAAAPLVPDTVLHARPERTPNEPRRPLPVSQYAPRDAGRSGLGSLPPWSYAAGVAVLVLLGWVLLHRPSNKGAAAAAAPQISAAQPRAAVASAPPAATPVARVVSAPVHGWHVVAYTYNHREQAAAKVAQVARAHARLQPQVFSPSGHAPYFVALGGVMSSGAAESVLHQARVSGLPRDTFIRNF